MIAPTPVVLLGGHMGTPLGWSLQTRFLSRSRLTITPAHHAGLSSIASMAEVIARDLPPEFDLVGWSFGGYIAFELYALLRGRIRRLALISTSARSENDDSRQRRKTMLADVSRLGLAEYLEQNFDRAMAHPEKLDPTFRGQLIAASVALGTDVLRAQVKAMISRRDSLALLSDIRCPTLVIAGSEDPVIPAKFTREIAQGISHASLEVLRDVGHCAPREAPEQVNALLETFFNSNFSGRRARQPATFARGR